MTAGGYSNGRKALDSIEQGDPATGLWTVVGKLPKARGEVSCAVAGGKLYVAGGYNNPSGKPLPAFL